MLFLRHLRNCSSNSICIVLPYEDILLFCSFIMCVIIYHRCYLSTEVSPRLSTFALESANQWQTLEMKNKLDVGISPALQLLFVTGSHCGECLSRLRRLTSQWKIKSICCLRQATPTLRFPSSSISSRSPSRVPCWDHSFQYCHERHSFPPSQ